MSVCPHTLEANWPLDADDYYAHTYCDCEKVKIQPKQPPDTGAKEK